MRRTKVAAFVVSAAVLGIAGWFAYHAGRPAPIEQPVVEYREVRSGAAGETGVLLPIDRAGHVTAQTLPLGAGSKTMHAQLTCDELAWLPEQIKHQLSRLRANYGSERTGSQSEVSVVDRWEDSEKRIVWRNPESSPKPPGGAWAGLVGPLEDIRRRAEEVPAQAT